MPNKIKQLIFISPFLFPAYLLRFKIASVPFTAIEVFIYALFALWLAGSIKNGHFVKNKKIKYYLSAALLLLIGAAAGAVMAPDFFTLPDGSLINAKRAALGIWKGWVMAPMLYFTVLTQVLKTRDDAEKILRAFIYSAALISLISIGLGIFADGFTYDFRLSGFYESANYLAMYIAPAIPLSIYFFCKSKKTGVPADWLNSASLAVLIFALLLTGSYAGILGVLGALGLYVLYISVRRPERRRKIGLAFLALLIGFTVILLTQLNTPKFRQTIDLKNRSSSSVRLEVYRTSWDLIKKNPIFGVGPSLFQANYQTAAPKTLGRAPLEWNMPHPHNIFLGFWLNAGLAGLAALIMIIFLANASFTYPLLAFWAILIHGLFDMPFWKNDLALIFWLIIAAILAMQDSSPSSS